MESCEVKKHLKPLGEPLPTLEESDIDTDEDSLCGSPTFGSGGCKVVECDMWKDHPSWQLDFELEAKHSTRPSLPEETTEEASQDLGCSANGSSQRLQGHYLCSLKKQIPPGV